ncbi:transposase [Bacillus nakamurai]|uniref:ribonuclease YeeF family protein n=1 Tax=Bacillus nakamurai TaxID=1793963 RepID=UPI00077867F0|nr:LXG domain-containing protein [Bacillus nakamurai]KXZ23304.1 transposase [Bacillus nakamurai]
MKTLDVRALREGIQHTIESLDKQKGQLAKLSQSVKQLAAMKDALRGKGGDAIRAFYEECHMPFLQFYEMVIDEYKSVLQKTNSRLSALEPDANGMIVQGFLEHEAKQGLRQAKQAAEQLVNDINRQAASISHIMSLPTVHDGIFREETHRAEKKIDDTLEQLYEFDSTQNQALKETKADIQTMKRYMEQLQSMYTGPKIGITTYNSGSILKSIDEEKLNDTFSMLKTQLASSEQSPMTVMLEKLNKHHHETSETLNKNMQNDEVEQAISSGGSTLTVLQKEAAAHPRIDGDIRVIHDKLYNHKGLKAIDTIEVIDETSSDTASIDYIGGKYHVYENGQIVREFRTGGKKKLEIVSRIPQNKIGGAKELDTYFAGTPYEVLEWIYPAGLVRNLAKHTVKRLVEKGVSGETKDISKKTVKKIKSEYSTRIDDSVVEIEKAFLPNSISSTFKHSHYRTVSAKEEITFYRAFGGQADAGGTFVTTIPAANRIQSKIDLALLPEWKNTRKYEAVIQVPKGTVLNIGRAEKQITKTGSLLKGNEDQVLLPLDYPLEWIKDIRAIKSK